MLYTKKGDKGTTKTLRNENRISKASALINALGAVDELNAWLGLLKAEVRVAKLEVPDLNLDFKIDHFLHLWQNDLFTIQAHLAGAGLTVLETRIEELENVTNKIETILPPIKSFFVPGGNRLSALFDIGRTISRRAEREVIGASEEIELGETI